MAEAFTYVINAGGITSSSTYPYTASKGSCRFDPSTAAAQLTGFTDVQTDEAALMKVRWADGRRTAAVTCNCLPPMHCGAC